MKRIALLLMLIAGVMNASAWESNNITAASLQQAGRYAEAAKYWEMHVDEITDSIYIGDHDVDTTLLRSYVTAINNCANCLYMIDDYLGLQKMTDRLTYAFYDFYDYADDDLKNDIAAYLNKIYGSLDYSRTEVEPYAYDSALRYYLEALQNADKEDTRFIETIYREVAQLYYKWGTKTAKKEYFENAKTYLGMVSGAYDSPLILSQIAITEARIGELEDDLITANNIFKGAMTNIETALKKTDKKSADYPEMLRKKGKIMMLKAVKNGDTNHKKARKIYEEYLDLQKKAIERDYKELTVSQKSQAWQAIHNFLYDCCRLGADAADMLYDLTLYSKGYLLRPTGTKPHTWKEVARKLAPDEVAVEFVAFDGNLLALVVDSSSKKPKLVEVTSIDSLLNYKISDWVTVKEAIKSQSYELKNDLYENPVIFKMIWSEPLMEAIGNKKKIYFSPDDFLHQLAIEYYLPDPSLKAYRLSSTSKVIDRRKVNADKALVCGGVIYNSVLPEGTAYDNDYRAYNYYVENFGKEINYLKGSKSESDEIIATRESPADILVQGSKATECFICEAAPKFNIVHLSTHGYSIDQGSYWSDIKPLIADNSLSQTGVLLSGAYRSINDEDFNTSNPDGILSAEEIARNDWSSVDLVVLSACQTALGYVSFDGVYGLQRGLKMSGVGGLILSLWNVSDGATYKLMSYFYQELIDNPDSARQAFDNARRRLMDYTAPSFGSTLGHLIGPRDTEDHKYNKPCYHTPFILIDVF